MDDYLIKVFIKGEEPKLLLVNELELFKYLQGQWDGSSMDRFVVYMVGDCVLDFS